MIFWPNEVLTKIGQLAEEYSILLIFDEVLTGFGRTGTMFAFEQIPSFIPDFLCLSKGLTAGFLPMGLTITKQSIYESFLNKDPRKLFFHGHSFTGNALSMAAAVANLELWKLEKPLKKISIIQDINKIKLTQMSSRIPIENTRSRGGIGAFELNSKILKRIEYGSEFSTQLINECLKQNIFIRPLGSTIYLMPPFCTKESELQDAWDSIGNILNRILL